MTAVDAFYDNFEQVPESPSAFFYSGAFYGPKWGRDTMSLMLESITDADEVDPEEMEELEEDLKTTRDELAAANLTIEKLEKEIEKLASQNELLTAEAAG